MQKKLEAELISIAHRILKLKNKSELDQLYLETGKLYEKLSVLKFLETHFADAKPTIGKAEVSDKLAIVFDAPEVEEAEVSATEVPKEQEKPEEQTEQIEEETPDPEAARAESEIEETQELEQDEPEADETIEADGGVDAEVPEEEQVHSIEEEAQAADLEHEVQETEEAEQEQATDNKEDDFKPTFELSFEKKEDTEDKKAPKQISFEDLLGGHDYSDEMFEKVADKKPEEAPKEEEAEVEPVEEIQPEVEKPVEEPQKAPETKPSVDIDKSEYEKPAVAHSGKTITFGLNDRIGFEKHLFGGSSEDMNRVISQLNTFDTFEEAQDFIEDMVKPDYNNWDNKDDYAKRFMEVVEKKFA